MTRAGGFRVTRGELDYHEVMRGSLERLLV